MKRAHKRFRKISTKITIWICTVMIFILLVSNMSAYVYFSKILLAKEYDNEKDKIELIMNQMDYIVEDIERFALAIAIDEDIQHYLTGKNKGIHQLEKKLGRWEVQRDYIFNLVLKNNDDEILLSDSLMISGISRHMYKSFMGDTLNCELEENQLYSFLPEIHAVNRLNNQNNILSFVMNVNHLEKYKSRLGQLIINLDYDKILDIITRNLKTVNFEKFYWVSEEGQILYPKEVKKEESEFMGEIYGRIQQNRNRQFEMADHYIVTGEETTSGWKYISITSMENIRKRIHYIFYFFLITGFLFSAAGAIGIERMIRRLMRPVTELKENMDGIKKDEFTYRPLVIQTQDEFQILADGYNDMMQRIQSYIDKSILYEKEKKQMEINLLLAQINPHFIYNTLNTIIYLSYKGETKNIAEVTRSFISLLQDSVKIHDGGLFSEVRDEVEVVKSYLEIQKKRYVNKFDAVIHVDEEASQLKILRSILQPIVENSLIHGIFCSKRKGELRIKIYRDGNALICIVEDNGVGMPAEKVEEIMERKSRAKQGGVYSIGLNNIMERLDLVYGSSYSFTINSEAGAFSRFTIQIPIIHEESAELSLTKNSPENDL